MKYRHFLLLLALLSAFSHSALGQSRTSGTVVELIDGKTVIVALPTGKVTVELQYIDVPEQGQPLYQTVRDHLQNLIVGKQISFRLGGFVGSRMKGGLLLNGIDVSQQMIRDGAAWHIPRETSGQDAASFAMYSEAESLAKTEKRGIWSIAGLKPAWEYRAERAEEQRLKEQADRAKSLERVHEEENAGSRKSPGKLDKGAGPLMSGYNEKTRSGFISTPYFGIEDKESANQQPTLAVCFAYEYKVDAQKRRQGKFLLYVVSKSERWDFIKKNPLVGLADEEKISIGKPKRIEHPDKSAEGELLVYEIERKTISKLINSKSMFLVSGNFHLYPKDLGVPLMLYNLLQETE